MLEHFHVPQEDEIRVMPSLMREATRTVFLKMGLSDEDADLATDVLIYADLNGVDTHGVSNMLRMYVQGYQAQNINPRPDMRVIPRDQCYRVLRRRWRPGVAPGSARHGCRDREGARAWHGGRNADELRPPRCRGLPCSARS